MQNMWISIVLIVLVIVVGLVAGRRLSAPGPQRRAVYSAFGTLAVLAIWFFLFVTFFPAEWIVPFFTVACIVIPICIYMGVARGGKKKVSSPGKSFEIPKKVVTPESAKPAKATKQTAAPKQQAKPISASASTQASSASPTSSAKTNAPSAKAPAEKAVHAAAKPSMKAPEKTASAKQEAPKASEKAAQKKDAAPKAAPTKQAQASQQKPADKPVKDKEQESKPRTTSIPQESASTPAAPPVPNIPSPEHKPETKQQPVASQEKPQETKSAEERIFEKPLDKPVVSEAIDPKISAAADIDILVNKAVAEELNDLEELVRPFGNNPAETLPVDQGPDLNVGAPVSTSTTSHRESEASTSAPGSSAPQQPQNEQKAPSTEAASLLTSASPAVPVSAPTPATTPAPSTATASAPVKSKPKQSPKEAFEEFSKRAAALRDQGAYAIAAMLYEEAAALAPTVNDMRNTQFDELACYVKAGDATKAKALASKLRQSSVLTRFERIKLDAVERMS